MVNTFKYFSKKIPSSKINISVESDLPARVSRSSCRKNRLPVAMSKSSFNRGIKELGFHPYKLVYQ